MLGADGRKVEGQERIIAVVLAAVGLLAVAFLPMEMKKGLGNPGVRARFAMNGLIGVDKLNLLGQIAVLLAFKNLCFKI